MNDRSDEQLVEAARRGEEKAFMEIVKRHESRVASTVIGMLGDCPEAEDVGQETFIRFYRALGSFRGESTLATYLTRIAINLSLNELRRRRKRSSRFSSPPVDELPAIPDREAENATFEEREIVRHALRMLKPEYRAVLVLRLMSGYSTRETAAILGIPVGTVLSRLARAQKKMREILVSLSGESR